MFSDFTNDYLFLASGYVYSRSRNEVSFFNDFIMFLEVNYFEMNCATDLSEML